MAVGGGEAPRLARRVAELGVDVVAVKAGGVDPWAAPGRELDVVDGVEEFGPARVEHHARDVTGYVVRRVAVDVDNRHADALEPHFADDLPKQSGLTVAGRAADKNMLFQVLECQETVALQLPLSRFGQRLAVRGSG